MLLATAQCNITATKCGMILLKWFSFEPQGNVPVIIVNDTLIKNVEQQKIHVYSI